MMPNNPKLDLVYINVYTKFGQFLSFLSQDIEKKKEILASIKGHNSVTNL